MKEMLMIHEVTKEMFELPLKDYILTFDDALYSFWYYWPLIREIPTMKMLFVPTGYIWNGSKRPQFAHPPFDYLRLDSVEAMELGDMEPYMTVDEVKQVSDDGLIIGGHGHDHLNFEEIYERESLNDFLDILRSDTQKMMEWFEDNLHYRPIHYVFPFCAEPRFMRDILRDEFYISEFYCRERVNVRRLLKK